MGKYINVILNNIY